MFGQSLLSGAFGTAIIFVPDENFSTQLYDGNGGPNSIGGKLYGAGEFNGGTIGSGGSYIELGNSTAIGNASAAVTMSTWVNFDNLNTQNFIIYRDDSSVQNQQGIYDYGNGNIYFQPENLNNGNFGYVSNSGLYTTGEWVHIAMVFDGSGTGNSGRLKAYINGNQVTLTYNNTIPSTTGAATTPLRIGGRQSGQASFSGSIDQVRLFNSALSAYQVLELYNETTTTASKLDFPTGAGCIAAYTLDNYGNTILSTEKLSTCDFPSGASCEALYEFNGNGNDTCGNYNGTPSNVTYGPGLFNKTAIFNGSTSYIQYPTLGNVFQNNYSISAWFRLEAYTSSGNPGYDLATIVSTFTDYYGWVAVNSATNKLRYYTEYLTQAPWGYGIESTTTINLNQWYHMTVTKSSTTGMKLYLNGVLENTESAATQNLASSAANTYESVWGNYSGSNPNQYSNFTGQIDQGRIFNSVLTQAQVTELSRGEPKYNGASNNVTYNGFIKFQPGLTWIKRTSSTEPHALYDSLRGPNRQLSSDSALAQAINTAPYEGLTSFDSYGFTLNNNGGVNGSSQAYASWNWKSGNEMWALDLDIGTTTGYVDVPNGVGALGNATSDLSFSCWFKIPDASIQSFIICSYVNPNYSKININTETNGKLRANFGDGTSSESSIYTTSTGWTDGNWHHLAYTMEWNSGSSYFDIKFYKDGSLDSSHTTSGQTVAMSGNGFTFGGVKNTTSGTTSAYSTAQIGQARLYNSVLSSTQVTELYNQKATKYDTLDFPTGAGCVAAYNFKGNPDDLSGAYNGQGNNDFIRQIGKDTINTDGSITSTVTANQNSGFSIISWVGNQTNGSIGHGLKKAPTLLILKDTSVAYNWYVFCKPTGTTDNLRFEGLNNTSAATVQNSQFTTTSSLIENLTTFASLNTTGSNMLIYAFHDVAKYSKIGTYVGNRPTTVTITTDFEPGWVLIKDTANTEGWVIIDNKRGDQLLEAQSTAGDTSYNSVQFTSTGFTVGDSGLVNTSGATIIYMAFAK